LIRWLWLGALIMALGGFLAVSDKRYRIRERATEPKIKPADSGSVAANPVMASVAHPVKTSEARS